MTETKLSARNLAHRALQAWRVIRNAVRVEQTQHNRDRARRHPKLGHKLDCGRFTRGVNESVRAFNLDRMAKNLERRKRAAARRVEA